MSKKIGVLLSGCGYLDGAEIREAISWSKVKSEAKQVTINGEASSLLPFMIAAVIERISK